VTHYDMLNLTAAYYMSERIRADVRTGWPPAGLLNRFLGS